MMALGEVFAQETVDVLEIEVTCFAKQGTGPFKHYLLLTAYRSGFPLLQSVKPELHAPFLESFWVGCCQISVIDSCSAFNQEVQAMILAHVQPPRHGARREACRSLA